MMNPNLDTQILEFLRQQQVPHRLLLQQEAAVTIEAAAILRGIRPAQMVKCVLLRDMSERYALACVPGHLSVDPKKVRSYLGWRRMTCATSDQVLQVTGYPVGAVTPLLLKTNMPILFDPVISQESEITISSGDLHAGIAIQAKDLLQLVQPVIFSIHREPPVC
ncbi:aminoacyl-tRNA deacylase [Vibrio gazogenes]|uniref:Cys-tRNA(Pro) deacylase n=1 Tax=Vibrio gazogenes DSM 21264 = NBRC 103151 TaxID=1123492 RepID=A0A1M5CQP1_VIBGA|nr:YbaK/EbsC family protein [Vibrio gazogenes]USP14163.1 YbaK/EbsC family protein [Vibrio gazogenes]SHF57080.1 Cys-tRNA(Pro) deacylase [Vibrio gazogenes DSM 21264] [Vibrio gazogenes DSM 21264 = NBRC 103151]